MNKKFRATLRFSFNDDSKSALRNKLAPILRSAGFTTRKKTGTGTWDIYDADLNALSTKISQVLDVISNPASPKTTLDHLWFYIDQIEDEN